MIAKVHGRGLYLVVIEKTLKVGTEWVEKGNTCENASNSVAGIARAIYERTFRIIADKCNETLCGEDL